MWGGVVRGPNGRIGSSDDPPTLGVLMPRYMVERTFTDGLLIPTNDDGAGVCLGVVGNNADVGATWVHSYVTTDKSKTFCIYDGPDPEAIHKASLSNGLPVDSISQVSVLDPYFYHSVLYHSVLYH